MHKAKGQHAAAMDDDTTLSHRAEVFRSKLIEDFQILECTSEEGRRKAPVYTSADIISQFFFNFSSV